MQAEQAKSPEHAHEHEHSHENTDAECCSDSDCKDPSHDHSHSERQVTTAATRFGITTFVYSARRPFVPERFDALVATLPFVRCSPPTATVMTRLPSTAEEEERVASLSPGPFKGVLRSKGFVWLASDSSVAFYWSQAGRQIELSQLGRWWAAVDRKLWPKEESALGAILDDMNGDWGDRRQELVFIGANLPETDIRAKLDECLASDEEMAEVTKKLCKAQPA
jgi:G3E family GTPase